MAQWLHVRPVTEPQIRAALANCSKGEAGRMTPPADLAELDFEALEFLGWRDPKAPQKAYLVLWQGDDLVGLLLRTPERISGKPVMCALCHTTHSGNGVALLAAPRPGKAGREGNTIGTYVCTDLRCSTYVRMAKATSDIRPDPGVDPERRAEQLAVRVDEFVSRVLAT